LKQSLRVAARTAVAAVATGVERTGITAWTLGTLPRVLERTSGGYTVSAYPALADEKTSVAVRVFETPAAADRSMAAGTRRLLLLTIPSPVPAISGRLSNDAKLTLMRNPSRNVGELIADCVDAATDALVDDAGGPAWDESGFTTLRDHVRAELHDAAFDVIGKVRAVLAASHAAEARMATGATPALLLSLTDARTQLSQLIYPGFVTPTGARRLTDLARYLRALDRRLEKLPQDPARDRLGVTRVDEVLREYATWLGELPAGAVDWPAVRDVRWMIEELRVNVFAQAIGTPYPISEKRIYKAMDDVTY
jgi:ATP-dependent helicase HrpA